MRACERAWHDALGGAGWGTRSVFDQRGDYSDVSKPKVDIHLALRLFFLACPCSPSPSPPAFLSYHLSRNTHWLILLNALTPYAALTPHGCQLHISGEPGGQAAGQSDERWADGTGSVG